ncbi:hypothetical protein FRC04_009572 [Tulasnella sp. 424]|nr:hypothetical protein FRC04_009572 [Tulasnella sp. 424]
MVIAKPIDHVNREFSGWETYPETTRFRNRPRPQVGSSSNHLPQTNRQASMNVAGPSNSQPRGRRSPEPSDDSSDDDSDRRSDDDSSQTSEDESSQTSGDDSSQTSDDDSNQSAGEEEDEERARALEAIQEKLNSCIVVGAKKALTAHQKLVRRETFDLERSEARGGMIFDYDHDSMVIELLCRIHDSSVIQGEAGPTLIVVSNEREIAKWTVAARDFSDRFQNSMLIYHGPKRSAAAPFLDYRIVITTYRVLSGDVGLDGLQFLRVILDGGEVIRNKKTQQSEACFEVNASYRWCCTKNSEFLDQFILLPPDDNAVYGEAPPTSELENRFLVFHKVNFNRGERKFYRALERRLDEVGAQYLRPRVLRRDGGDIARRMVLLSLRACCHPGLVWTRRRLGKIPNHDDERRCNICQQRIDRKNNSRFCAPCNENVMRKFPEDPSHSANPKVREMLAILRRTEINTHGRGRVAIVCQFKDFAKIIADHLSQEQFRFAMFHDSNRMQKERAMEALRRRRDPATVALVTVNLADIHGLDLREFVAVILMDLWWDPRLDDRRFLIDHDVRVDIYKLYFAQSIESQALKVLVSHTLYPRSLSDTELQKLLTRPESISDNNHGIIQQLGIRSTPLNLDFLLKPA